MAVSEKITVNMEVVDLGKIDLLVDRGFYSNRTDCIKHAVRRLLAEHTDVVEHYATVEPDDAMTSTHKTISGIGLWNFSRIDLEKYLAKGQKVSIRWVGMAVIDADVTAEMADQVFESVSVYGVLKMPPAVRDILRGRIRS